MYAKKEKNTLNKLSKRQSNGKKEKGLKLMTGNAGFIIIFLDYVIANGT